MAKIETVTLICDRCKNEIKRATSGFRAYLRWQIRLRVPSKISFNRASDDYSHKREYDLCKECTLLLERFMTEKGGSLDDGVRDD